MSTPAINSNTAVAPRDFTARELRLIRHTLARDCDDSEFDLFMEMSRRQGLDPFRKQVYAIVTNKNNPDRRQLVIVTGIDGYRAKAQRCQDYRPGETKIEAEPDEKDPKTNPAGIIKATYIAYKQDNRGEWHPVTGEAWWEEFVPLYVNEERGICEIAKGKDNWRKMPRRMIAKCAEADALRKGWPEEFSGLHVTEEMDRNEVIDLTASEIVEEDAKQARQARLGGRCIMVQWDYTSALDRVPIGQFADRCMAFIEKCREGGDLATLDWWYQQNKTAALTEFWVEDKSAALEIKKAYEAARGELSKQRDESAA